MKRDKDDPLRMWFLLAVALVVILLACAGACVGLSYVFYPAEKFRHMDLPGVPDKRE